MVVMLSVLSYFLFSRFVVTSVVVSGRSMVPTLQDGDRCLLNRMPLWFRAPERGDMVVIEDAGHSDYAVKRIVALPGEDVRILEGKVWVNESVLPEPYLPSGIKTRTFGDLPLSLHLEESEYFVLGDNRPTSEDSRAYGALKRSQIVGLLVK